MCLYIHVCMYVNFWLQLYMSLGTNFEVQFPVLTSKTHCPVKNLHLSPYLAHIHRAHCPHQSRQSWGHWAVARRTALTKIPCVSPRLYYVGSVRCHLRTVCKLPSFFIFRSHFFTPLTLLSFSFSSLSLSVTSQPVSLAKFGIHPIKVHPLYMFFSLAYCPFLSPCSTFPPSLPDPPRETDVEIFV